MSKSPWYIECMALGPNYEAAIDEITVFDKETKVRLKRDVLVRGTILANDVAYLHGVRMGSYYGTLTVSYQKLDARRAKVAWAFCKELQVLSSGFDSHDGVKDLAAVALPMDKFERKIGRRQAAIKFLDFSVIVPLDPQNNKTQSQIFQYLLDNGLSVDKDDFPRRISIESVEDYFSRMFVERAAAKLSEGSEGATAEAYGLRTPRHWVCDK